MESVYSPKNTDDRNFYSKLINSTNYKKQKKALAPLEVSKEERKTGSFQFLPGLVPNRFRTLVVRKPLLEIFENTHSVDEQREALKKAIAEGINLIIKPVLDDES